MKIKNFFSSLRWTHFVSKRFSRVDREGRSAVTSFLASAGICFGVMTLISVISVMNGFQRSFIDSILEVSSYHIRASKVNDDARFSAFCLAHPQIKSATPFYEAQSLVVSQHGNQSAAVIRAVPENIVFSDEGFASECKIISGSFDLSEIDSVILGRDLARALGARTGSKINLLALSGGNDVELISQDRVFTVKGIFRTGYSDINSSYAFINSEAGKNYFGKDAVLNYGLKISDMYSDSRVISQLVEEFEGIKAESWRSYNRSFFGALRIEKNMLMILVLLIFVVVAVNIFNGMRRMVFERREEISTLCAFGGKKELIQSIFIMQGFLIGVSGAIPGLILGLFISVNISKVFMILSQIVYHAQVFAVMLINPQNARYISENPMYMIYANIPPKIIPSEVVLITIFGIFSSLAASWSASRGILKLTVCEVMRDE